MEVSGYLGWILEHPGRFGVALRFPSNPLKHGPCVSTTESAWTFARLPVDLGLKSSEAGNLETESMVLLG